MIASFTTLIELNSTFFLLFHEIYSKKRTYIKPKTEDTKHFPLENSVILLLNTENHEELYSEKPENHSL